MVQNFENAVLSEERTVHVSAAMDNIPPTIKGQVALVCSDDVVLFSRSTSTSELPTDSTGTTVESRHIIEPEYILLRGPYLVLGSLI